MTSPKTYKRELSAAMLALLAVGWSVAFYNTDQMMVDGMRYLTPFVFTFAAAAYGLDAYSKQIRG